MRMKFPNEDAIVAELARRDFLTFVKLVWPELVPGTPFQDNWHFHVMAEHLMAVRPMQKIDRLICNVQPRSGKSLFFSVCFPLWVWLNKPHTKFICASHGLDLAYDLAGKRAKLLESDTWARYFSRYCKPTRTLAKKQENSKGGVIFTTSVGGSLIGMGGDVIILDDPANAMEALSQQSRATVNTWFDVALKSRLDDQRTGAIIIVAQRLHEDDIPGHALKEKNADGTPVWTWLCLRTEYEMDTPTTMLGFKDPRTQMNELLWPDRFGPKEIAKLKTMGTWAFTGQYQQRPAPLAGGLFQRAWWNFYKVLPGDLEGILLSCDATFKEGIDNDYVVIQTWGWKGANRYLISQIRDRMSFTQTQVALRCEYYKAKEAFPDKTIDSVLVEDKANGSAIIDTLREEIPAVLGVNPEGSKEARAASVSPQVEARNIYLPDPSIASWVSDFVDECALFPNGAHDDQVDAFSQAVRWITAKIWRPFYYDMGDFGVRENPTAGING